MSHRYDSEKGNLFLTSIQCCSRCISSLSLYTRSLSVSLAFFCQHSYSGPRFEFVCSPDFNTAACHFQHPSPVTKCKTSSRSASTLHIPHLHNDNRIAQSARLTHKHRGQRVYVYISHVDVYICLIQVRSTVNRMKERRKAQNFLVSYMP